MKERKCWIGIILSLFPLVLLVAAEGCRSRAKTPEELWKEHEKIEKELLLKVRF